MAQLKAVKRGNHWRIQMSWPNRMPRFFGDFETEAEATRWIKEHSWLAPDKVESAKTPNPEEVS